LSSKAAGVMLREQNKLIFAASERRVKPIEGRDPSHDAVRNRW
jgi:hypothetical protein